jgi:hypothetical protein
MDFQQKGALIYHFAPTTRKRETVNQFGDYLSCTSPRSRVSPALMVSPSDT